MASSMAWILLVVLAPYVRSFPSGATHDTCLSMRPNHGVPAQLSVSPFLVMPNANTIPQGRSLDVYITTKSGETRQFHGFLFQARAQGTTTNIGEWVNIPWDAKKINCGVTHRNPGGRKLSKFTWQAPAKFSGIVEFVATVVHAKTQFWMNIAFPIMVQGPSTLRPVTTPRTTPTTPTITSLTTSSTTTSTTTPTTSSTTSSTTTSLPTTKAPTTTTSSTTSATRPGTSLTTPSTSGTTASPVITSDEQSSVESTIKPASKPEASQTTPEAVTNTEEPVTTTKSLTGSDLQQSGVTTEPTSQKPEATSDQPPETSKKPSGTSEQPDVSSQQINDTTSPPKVTPQQNNDSDETTEDVTKSSDETTEDITESAEVTKGSDGTPKEPDVTSSPSDVPAGRTDVSTQSSRFTTEPSTQSTTAKPKAPKTNVNFANSVDSHDRSDCNTGSTPSLQIYLTLGTVFACYSLVLF